MWTSSWMKGHNPSVGQRCWVGRWSGKATGSLALRVRVRATWLGRDSAFQVGKCV